MKNHSDLVRRCTHGYLMISYSFPVIDPDTGAKITKIVPSCEACGSDGTEVRPFHPSRSHGLINSLY